MRMRTRGFSLTELVAIIVIIGALAVLAVPRLNTSGFDAYAFHEKALTAVRYARTTAAASTCPVDVAVDAGADRITLSYQACNGMRAEPVRNPATGGDYTVQAGSGVAVETRGARTIMFDAYGATGPSGNTILIGGAEDIVVEARTGYIR